ncbi:MAG TPA: hypothetical protein VF450_26955, partial [Noviherbaspirillum sp.]
MKSSYHQVGDLLAVQSRNGLQHPRARRLYEAIARNADFELIELRCLERAGQEASEILVVDCTCHGVPPHNNFGISFRERLAIVVHAEPGRLPETWALRQDFPDTGHRNHVGPGKPASLCLYAQPPRAIYRTWTAAGYLRRIQWWLECAATGTLHDNDYVPEQFFFESHWEIVLPVDFNDKIGDPRYTLTFPHQASRKDDRRTFIGAMVERANMQHGGAPGVFPMAVRVDPVVATQVEREPWTIGELEERFAQRGTSVMSRVLGLIEQHATSYRVRDANVKGIILVIAIPLSRPGEDQPSR